MKKIFNYALLAAVLLVGVNVNAAEKQIQLANLQAELNAANDGDILKISDGPTTLTLTQKVIFYSGKQVTLDLNNHDIEAGTGVDRLIKIVRGDLTITGTGKMSNMNKGKGVIQISGTHTPLGKDAVFSKLTINENVNLEGESRAIDVYTRPAAWITKEGVYVEGGANKYLEELEVPADAAEKFESTQMFSNGSWGVSENVFVDMKGTAFGGEYALQVSGVIQMPKAATEERLSKHFITSDNEANYLACVPYIHIFPTAKLGGSNLYNDGTEENPKWMNGEGVYAAGYAKWLIQGECYGATGVYIKSGDVTIDGANIYSTWSSEVKDTEGTTSGTKSGGNGVVIESNGSYKGKASVTIQGDTKIQGGAGYGIEQIITNGTTDQLNIIDIKGGEIGKGDAGTFIMTAGSESKVEISAGSSDGETWTVKNEDGSTTNVAITNFIPTDEDEKPLSHKVEILDAEGKVATTIIVPGPAPMKISDSECGSFNLNSLADNAGIDFGNCGESQELSKDLVLGEIIMNGNVPQTITIPDDMKLTVKYLLMGGKSQIIVEAGGMLIVSGELGVKNVSTDNIIIKAQEGKSGKFLFAPEVTSNRHPNATVTFFSKAFTNSKADQQQDLIGIPMQSVKNITISDNNYAAVFDVWRKDHWDRIGGINVTPVIDYNKFDVPFSGYCIYSNNPNTVKLSYDISGELLGNTEPSTVRILKGWTSTANSWTGDVNVDAFLKALKDNKFNGLTQSIYLANITGSHIVWNAFNSADDERPLALSPMQAMMLNNTGNQAVDARILTYKELVWDPVMEPAVPGAPRAQQDVNKVSVRISSQEGITDRVVIAEAEAEFSAPKYMSNPVCVYAHADENYDIFATSAIENTFIGFNTNKAGIYTLSFGKVNGNYALVDNNTNARIEMIEGATYEFLAEEGEDAYRFQIVAGAQAPTEMQKTNAAVKATKALINDQIVINNGERFFNVLGTEVK